MDGEVSASIIDGKAIAATIRGEIAAGVADLKAKAGVVSDRSRDRHTERERDGMRGRPHP